MLTVFIQIIRRFLFVMEREFSIQLDTQVVVELKEILFLNKTLQRLNFHFNTMSFNSPKGEFYQQEGGKSE